MDIHTPDDIINPGGRRRVPPDFSKFFIPVVLLFIIFYSLLSAVYSIETDEVGVVQRFGKYVGITKPGLHAKLPLGIDRVTHVKVQHVFDEEFGFATLKAGVQTRYSNKDYSHESLMLTGDLNIAEVEWIVQFKKSDPVKYLFHLRDWRKVIRDASESVMREVVGDNSISEVLTERRVEMANEVKKELQAVLDKYDSGIQIVTVKLQDVNPPDSVKPSFNEVNQAKQEREQLINQAWKEYNKQIPRAKGEAEKIIREAEGYALDRVNRAQGDAERFVLTWQEYKNAKDVTRERLYLDSMQDIIASVKQMYVIDSDEKGVLPLLKLNEEGGLQ